MKLKLRYTVWALLAVAALVLAGCGGGEESGQSETAGQSESSQEEAAETQAQEEADAMTTASVVDDKAGFRSAASADGTWIIAVLRDLSFDEELVVEGEFTRRGEIARKIALYAQDEERNVTDRYTLTAPRLTVRSENTRLQGGTFVGDVYVEANGFQVVDATVDGNVYFSSEEYRESFSLTEGGEVTGEVTVQ